MNLFLAGCVSAPSPTGADVEDIDLSTSGEERLYIPDTSRPQPGASQAVDQLLASADTAITDGKYERAAALAERAIRLAPNDARPYLGLAQVHFYQNQWELGRSFLAKARALAASDKKLLRAIEKLERGYGI